MKRLLKWLTGDDPRHDADSFTESDRSRSNSVYRFIFFGCGLILYSGSFFVHMTTVEKASWAYDWTDWHYWGGCLAFALAGAL